MPIDDAGLTAAAQALCGPGGGAAANQNGNWGYWVDEAVEELYQLLIASGYVDVFTVTADFTLAGTTNFYTLGAGALSDEGGSPGGFRQLIGVTINPTTPNRRSLRKYNFAERDLMWIETRYRLMGNRLYVEPAEQAPGSYRVTYVRGPGHPHSDGGNNLEDSLTPYTEWLATWMAIQALAEEKSDTAQLEKRLETLTELIETSATTDAGEPESITDWEDDGGIQ